MLARRPVRQEREQKPVSSPTVATVPPEGTTELAPPAAPAAQVPAATPRALPLIDRHDPTHALTLQLLERRLIPILSQGKAVDGLSDAELAELVGRLSAVWLSLAVYEASIAKVESRPDNKVVITVPPYPQMGAAFEEHVMRDLLHGKTDQELQKVIRNNFQHFGAYPQTLEIGTLPKGTGGHDEPIYSILHRFDGLPFGPLVVHSGLPVSRLGPYSAFLQFFPPLSAQ